jgi:hypothetical protein
MKSRHYDIVRKDYDRSAIWLEAASDLKTAESRIAELKLCWPGEFQIMDQQNHRIMESFIGPPDCNGDIEAVIQEERTWNWKRSQTGASVLVRRLNLTENLSPTAPLTVAKSYTAARRRSGIP